MTIQLQKGYYKGIPYICVVKDQNQGKRDSLVFIRSMLYNFNRRHEKPLTMFSPELFHCFTEFFTSHGLDKIDFLAGMDADTVFDDTCIYEMIKVIRQEGEFAAGVCGHVCVDFEDKPWGAWNLFQSTEYTMTQGLRRSFQSSITGKVNCLPGCCQLIRVCEATMGDKVLRDLFGHVPKPNDSMIIQVMGNYSEDSIHASYIFSSFPQYHTAQALRAKAYTTVPQSWSVFLSQRKRWSLGSISNDLLMACRPRINFFERCVSLISVFTWFINPFITAAAVSFIVALCRGVHNWRLIVGLASLLMVRYVLSQL
jgi:chitin synthase